jgi:sortase B
MMITIVVLLLALNLFMLTHLPEQKSQQKETLPTHAETEMVMTTMMETTTETTVPETTVAPTEETNPLVIMDFFIEKLNENPDITGWVTIEGTKLDYPVMYTPSEPDKYLHADFNGNWSIGGVPYLEEGCSLSPESDNLIIYGHNMANGTMFHTLMSYDQKHFWEAHPTIRFSTLYEERTYEIIAAFYDRVYYKYEDCFKFYQFIDAEDEAHFQEAIDYFKKTALYDTGVTAEYGDKLITLVTCAYHVDNGRFVVVAKDVTDRNG